MGVPLVLAYHVIAYGVFRGRLDDKDVNYEMDARGYMKWLSILCLVMALFGTAVMLVGYKVPTIGLVATVATLVIAAAALGWKARER